MHGSNKIRIYITHVMCIKIWLYTYVINHMNGVRKARYGCYSERKKNAIKSRLNSQYYITLAHILLIFI